MTVSKKKRVAVLYGGASGEHEISLISAASVLKNLDRRQFDLLAISIDKNGNWRSHDVDVLLKSNAKSLPTASPGAVEVFLSPHGEKGEFQFRAIGSDQKFVVDVIFPVMHGTNCEDGSIQGLMEISGVPYVGCGVMASAIAMDKEYTKRLVAAAGIAMVPYAIVHAGKLQRDLAALKIKIANELKYPVFIKPASLGSSVGVHKVKDEGGLEAAIRDALRYDEKILVEKFIPCREIELSVMEGETPAHPPRVGVVGEIIPHHEFYSYEAKYLDENGAGLKIPAAISESQMRAVKEMAIRVFEILNCEGMARVDLFMDKNTSEIYLNEVNTIPGFTQISMYPKLWEAAGLPYADLLTELVRLGLARGERKARLTRDWTV